MDGARRRQVWHDSKTTYTQVTSALPVRHLTHIDSHMCRVTYDPNAK